MLAFSTHAGRGGEGQSRGQSKNCVSHTQLCIYIYNTTIRLTIYTSIPASSLSAHTPAGAARDSHAGSRRTACPTHNYVNIYKICI